MNTEEIKPMSDDDARKSALKIAHEQFIKAMEDHIRHTQPITFQQQQTGIAMYSDDNKKEAVQEIARTVPNIITAIFQRHWVTTVLGIVAIIPAVLTATGIEIGWVGSIVSAIATGAGLIFSKSVTSND